MSQALCETRSMIKKQKSVKDQSLQPDNVSTSGDPNP
jgi:hypothetical protein